MNFRKWLKHVIMKILKQRDGDKSKWIIRMELNKESMLDKHISMDDIHFAVSNSYNDDISCVYSDMNAEKLVFRIRLNKI